MRKEEIQQLWNDPANWATGVYRCADDPRVIVAKRSKAMGWTVNFAHPLAWPVILFAVVLAVGPGIVAMLAGVSPGTVPIVVLGSVAVLMLFAHWLTQRF